MEREHPDRVENLKAAGATRINSRVNGEQRPNGLIDFMQFYDMLPTPRANQVNGCDLDNPKLAERNKSNLEEEVAKAVVNGLLPTPTAIEGVKWTNTWNPNSQMGQSLSAMAGSGMLPTPQSRDHKGISIAESKRRHGESTTFGETLPDAVERLTKSEAVGASSRLSPLFTEEMMGFPLMWTALPFLSESGAPKPSKPTATPSSPK